VTTLNNNQKNPREQALKLAAHQVKRKHRLAMISVHFMAWIEKLNLRVIERKKLFFASSHWLQRRTTQVFSVWRAEAAAGAEFRR